MTSMKSLLYASLLTIAAGAACAQTTAYEALRALAASKGDGVLRRVVEVSGQKGTPQPLVWRVVLADPQARGGVREFEVSAGRILSERAPAARTAGSAAEAALAMSALKLDSDGAFRVANAEAWRSRVGFDSASFWLRKDDETGVPVWVVEVFDQSGRSRGVMRISGTDGRLLSARGMGDRPPGPTTWPDNQVVRESGDGGFLGRTNRTLEKVGRSVKDGSVRAAGTVQYWFTGRQTIGAPETETPQPDDRD